VPQDHLEPVLLRHARALGARVRFGVELVRLTPRPDGVEALLSRADGSLERVRTRYLIGADGVRSTVRRALGVPMHGPGLMVEAIAAHFHAPLWPLVGERRHTIYWIRHPEADGVLVPSGRDDRWVYGTMAPPGKLDFAKFDEREMLRRIRLASGDPKLTVPIERIGRFTFTAKLADRFRDGDVFLIGDAAHRATPRGGTGMNTAIRDGYDLGWKLAWVLRGWAEPHLLDSYEAERRPVAEHNVLRSAQPTGSLRQVSEELHVDLAGRIPHIWVDGRRSTLDLPRPGLTLLTGPEGGRRPCEPARPYRAAPVTVWRLPALTARALGIATGGSLLLRPDAVPARVTAGSAAVAA
jgi:2-polyprenyl-6-methoxyphenol hydroxylase-like FAD-dependent oxidoreductase